jgi:hypothetical protein
VSVEKMVAEAEKTLGWSDENNTKKTPVHTWYEAKFGNPDPGKYAWDWCDGWITYVAHKSGNAGPVRCLSGQSYTVAHAQAFKANGEWHAGAAGVARGDVVFFDWGNGIEHVGLALGPAKDGMIPTIEGNTLNVVAYRQRDTRLLAGYGRPKYPTTPPSTGGGTTVPTTYTPPPFPVGLRPGSASPSAKPLQRALKAAGYMAASVVEADNYGPNTEASVDRFYDANPELTQPGSYDPIIGPKGWAELHREAYGGAKPPAVKPTPPPPVTTPVLGEPPHDYRRVTHGGRTVNVRTDVMLKAARGLMNASTPFALTQGSYSTGVSASAGTHDGGGVVDINTNGLNVNATLLALRRAGFAAWYRSPSEGFAPHIHACAIGDREMSSGARSQVAAYFAGRNGLANNRADTAPASVGRPYPQWARKYA